ncbi:hypothetical protein IQ250_24005 [Pseudanabaenaceae cyanobacterium LEGE 13415]|nr:hypothetical protein [Pseudanabaenaceae cyanobacterium LEGE 13415]
MTEQQQILQYIEALPGESVKAIVQEWVKQPHPTLDDVRQLAEAAHRSKDIDNTVGFPNVTEDEILEECETRLKQYSQTQRGVPHEQVARWLHSLSSEHPLPCPKSSG